MDVISQAVLGASFSQSFAKDKVKQLSVFFIGALAGMAPDLDVLIYSNSDSLLFLEFHRQFTHSLFFIPCCSRVCHILGKNIHMSLFCQCSGQRYIDPFIHYFLIIANLMPERHVNE